MFQIQPRPNSRRRRSARARVHIYRSVWAPFAFRAAAANLATEGIPIKTSLKIIQEILCDRSRNSESLSAHPRQCGVHLESLAQGRERVGLSWKAPKVSDGREADMVAVAARVLGNG